MEVSLNTSTHVHPGSDEKVSLKWGDSGHLYAVLQVGKNVTLFLNSKDLIREFVETVVSDYNEMVSLKVDQGES